LSRIWAGFLPQLHECLPRPPPPNDTLLDKARLASNVVASVVVVASVAVYFRHFCVAIKNATVRQFAAKMLSCNAKGQQQQFSNDLAGGGSRQN